ncbi:MAG: hypothetical protein HKN32_00110 [Flavobacteriales bacterium]|nr:hypothetical protein [Flavobacteriales bacterium]
MKCLLSFAWILIYPFVLFSQDNPSVGADAEWNKFESKRYIGSIQERTYANRELISEDETTFMSRVEVIEASPEHYTLNFKTNYNGRPGVETAYEFANHINGLDILVRTDETGLIESVENRPYVLSEVKKLWKQTFQHLGSGEEVEQMWQDKLDRYTSSDDLDMSLTGELREILFLHGIFYPLGEVYEFDSYIAGFDVYENIPANCKLTYTSLEGGILKAELILDIDEEGFGAVIDEVVHEMLMAEFDMKMEEEFVTRIREELGELKITNKVFYEVDAESGWMLEMRDRTVINFRGEKNVILTTLKLERESE